MYTVYVLYSEKFNKHYTGYSSNFDARLLSHNIFGKKDWSVKYRPWKVIFTEQFENKSLAIKKEKWLKSGVGRSFNETPRSPACGGTGYPVICFFIFRRNLPAGWQGGGELTPSASRPPKPTRRRIKSLPH